MPWRNRYAVILVQSTGHAIRAEKVLNMANIGCKLIPVPRQISSNCGVCVRVERSDVDAVKAALQKNKVDFESIHEI
ncbi:MAG: DUF3343 domain-containing protein [Anaerolineae bacterium]|nr:DUF3343 domain-containing protein [Anaerolineae bacterium]